MTKLKFMLGKNEQVCKKPCAELDLKAMEQSHSVRIARTHAEQAMVSVRNEKHDAVVIEDAEDQMKDIRAGSYLQKNCNLCKPERHKHKNSRCGASTA